ncbi:helix-turn-helix domain-containing protein [Nioella sp.]|uniref:helix-turn-helix domain-containing protein n=1 Tax=Nioella sp. TaxID=1912091 RepID=UPI00351907AE
MNDMGTPVVRASGASFERQMNGLLRTRFDLRSDGARSYEGEIRRSYVSPHVRLADISFTPHSTRLKAGKSSRQGRSFLVSHQIEGHACVRQGGREAVIKPNQIFFIDTTLPFEIDTDDIRTRSIYLNSHFWQEVFPERELYTATALDCDRGLGYTCKTMIDEMFGMEWDIQHCAMQRLAGCLANLLAVSMVTNNPLERRGHGSNEQTLQRIHEAILRNLADPDLDCARIAEEVGLSVRQVHAVFSGTGSTLMRHIWKRRLSRIASDLANVNLSHKPVSTIAFEWGFNEAAHFSRQFKAAFGMPPAKYREHHMLNGGRVGSLN